MSLKLGAMNVTVGAHYKPDTRTNPPSKRPKPMRPKKPSIILIETFYADLARHILIEIEGRGI